MNSLISTDSTEATPPFVIYIYTSPKDNKEELR